MCIRDRSLHSVELSCKRLINLKWVEYEEQHNAICLLLSTCPCRTTSEFLLLTSYTKISTSERRKWGFLLSPKNKDKHRQHPILYVLVKQFFADVIFYQSLWIWITHDLKIENLCKNIYVLFKRGAFTLCYQFAFVKIAFYLKLIQNFNGHTLQRVQDVTVYLRKKTETLCERNCGKYQSGVRKWCSTAVYI